MPLTQRSDGMATNSSAAYSAHDYSAELRGDQEGPQHPDAVA